MSDQGLTNKRHHQLAFIKMEIGDMFTWRDTEEGTVYWGNLYDAIEEMLFGKPTGSNWEETDNDWS